MDRILRFAAIGALGLAFVVAAPAAKAQDGVTVGGWIEVIGGSTDNDKAGSVSGISRGLFSRIAVSYDNTLNNGLMVSGRAAYQLNQRGSGANVTEDTAMQADRMDASTNYAPDVLYVSVGGGFGTLTFGAAAPASCSVLPRPIAFLNGVNGTHYTLFTGLDTINGTFSEFGYCGTPEQISYTTPTVNGFRAMLTWAPDNESNQGTSLKNAQLVAATGTGITGSDISIDEGQGGSNVKDRMDLAASWSTSMGAANVSVGVGYQQGRYQDGRGDMSSTAISAIVGMGALSLGAKWYETEEGEGKANKHGGYSLAAKYDVGNLTLASTYSTAEKDDDSQEDSALVLGASFAVGGGLTTWVEYMDLETDCTPNCTANGVELESESDDIILVGVTLGF